MILEFLKMNGYGIYIWLSYGFVFLSCSIVYFKVLRTLKKYENAYKNELMKIDAKDRDKIAKNSKVARYVLSSLKETV